MAGLLVLVVSVALVVNADLHKKRGAGFARDAAGLAGESNLPK